METKSRSIRVDDEVWAQFCARKGTQNEVLRDLLAVQGTNQPAQPNGLQSAQLNRIEDAVVEIVEAVRRKGQTAASSAILPARSAPTIEGEFSCQCAHCGARFQGGTKYASLCDDCQATGHRNVRPHDCRECQSAASV